jgi:hypothetical protein
MAYSGAHNVENVERLGRTRPNPDGYMGGPEDFETVWTLKGAKVLNGYETQNLSTDEIAKIGRNHNRLTDSPGF